MKNVVLFDIDYSLIDSSVSKSSRRPRIAKLLNITTEEVLAAENSYVKKDSGFTDFDPNDYINHICKILNADCSEISKIFFDDSNFIEALYPDVIQSLEKIKDTYDCGIFSEGFEDFQLIKLHKSGILKYFKQSLIYIFRRKLTEDSLSLLPDKCFIIDDNLPVICGLAETNRFRPIWLNRKTKEKHDTCITIFDLTDLDNVMENYSTK